MTQTVLILALALLSANLIGAIWRVVRGPSGRDRLLGVVLSGTTGCGLLLITSELAGVAPLRDSALVLVALSTVVVLARLDSERIGEPSPGDGAPPPRDRGRRGAG